MAKLEILGVCMLFALFSGSNAQACGRLMRPGDPADISVPDNWTMCYIDARDRNLYETPCRDLLQGLYMYDTSTALMAAGGNFGCWNLLSYPDIDQYNACNNNFQHNLRVDDCLRCTSMAVCIMYPGGRPPSRKWHWCESDLGHRLDEPCVIVLGSRSICPKITAQLSVPKSENVHYTANKFWVFISNSLHVKL